MGKIDRRKLMGELLDVYERSRYVRNPAYQGRRVMLGQNRMTFYHPEDVHNRDGWNDVARYLEEKGLIEIEWLEGIPVMKRIILRLDHVADAYGYMEELSPQERAKQLVATVMRILPKSRVPWIEAFLEDLVQEAEQKRKFPRYYKKAPNLLEDVLQVCREYESLGGEPILTRVLSMRCYQDSKYFERHVKDEFLRIAKAYNGEFRDQCDQEEGKERDELKLLGIYSMPELYELKGPIVIHTKEGSLDIGTTSPFGIALESDFVETITAIDLSAVRHIISIENKTNYIFYRHEVENDTLVLYQGGFMSPQQKRWVGKIFTALPRGVPFYFWGDMDLGGIRMFYQLKEVVPELKPYGMDEKAWWKYKDGGLRHKDDYWKKVEDTRKKGLYPEFTWLLDAMLKERVTVEQEAFIK